MANRETAIETTRKNVLKLAEQLGAKRIETEEEKWDARGGDAIAMSFGIYGGNSVLVRGRSGVFYIIPARNSDYFVVL